MREVTKTVIPFPHCQHTHIREHPLGSLIQSPCFQGFAGQGLPKIIRKYFVCLGTFMKRHSNYNFNQILKKAINDPQGVTNRQAFIAQLREH